MMIARSFAFCLDDGAPQEALHGTLVFTAGGFSRGADCALRGWAEARFIEVDSKTKRTPDGSNFAAIFPLGLVPLLRLDDGSLLSEIGAILQYIANRISGIEPRPYRWICTRAFATMVELHRHGIAPASVLPAR
jgi:glutathione S-transferase